MGGGLEFETFYATEFQRVFKAICLTTGNRDLSHDVTQQAFEQAFVRWRRLSDKTWAGGWVMTTALNLMRKERARPVATTLDPDLLPPSFDHSDLALIEQLRRLPHRQKTVALLYYLADNPVHEIAQVMEIAEGTVKALLSQARDNLRRNLGATDG